MVIGIRAVRKSKGISQEQLAEALNVTQTAISKWERGETKPRYDMLQRIAEVLGVSVAYLTGDTPIPEPLDIDLSPPDTAHAVQVKVLSPDFSACCGNGIDWQDEAVPYDYEYTMLDAALSRYGPLISMSVSGDSMEPYIEHGDNVLFSQAEPELERVPNGATVVVNYEGRMIVRGMFTRGPLDITLRAWNREAYPDIHPQPDEYFRVLGVVRRVIKQSVPPSMI